MLSKVLGTQPPCTHTDMPMDMPMISLDVSQAFYHTPLNPASAIHLVVSDRKLVYCFWKAPMIPVSALFSSISSLLPSQLNYLIAGIVGLLLIEIACLTSSRYHNSVSHCLCCFLESFGVRIDLINVLHHVLKKSNA